MVLKLLHVNLTLQRSSVSRFEKMDMRVSSDSCAITPRTDNDGKRADDDE